MKNKKGISIGRIILYVLFLSLIGLFVWTLFITFKAMKKKDPINNTSVNSSLRMVDNNSSVIRNLYNKAAYPFVNIAYNGSTNNTHSQTGSFIWVDAGTYSASVDSSLLTNYKWAVTGSSIPSYNRDGYTIFDTSWVNGSSTTFTLSTGCYLSFYIMRINDSTIDYNYLNSLDYMINVGSSHSYVEYDSNFVNASSYITNSYFYGQASWVFDDFYGQSNFEASLIGYVPFVNTTDYKSTYKTTYNPVVYNSSDLFIGDNISQLYSQINNSSYSGYYYTKSYTISYNNNIDFISIYYECLNPIPINYFSFGFYGTDVISNSNVRLFLNCNDNISIYVDFNNLEHFDYNSILGINPNINSISSFGFYIYNSSWNNVGIQNKSWSNYSSFCNFHIVFDNYYGDAIWQAGFDAGYRQGLLEGDEGLRNSNDYLQNKVNDLTSQVDSLNSRVNQQSEIITQLNNDLQTSSNNFKGLFFTFADIPFKTVSNALGFEFWGINLFRFFVGIITALGILWLIKRLYK